jgi:hypothetical protein
MRQNRKAGRERERARAREVGYNGLQRESISQFGIYIPQSARYWVSQILLHDVLSAYCFSCIPLTARKENEKEREKFKMGKEKRSVTHLLQQFLSTGVC